MNLSYASFFKEALGCTNGPYEYQRRLADGPWPQVVNVPTGMGKTAAIAVAWLYKRFLKAPSTPRRLVYCLPMRVLVEQTATNIRQWITQLKQAGIDLPIDAGNVHVLMGGEVDVDWDLYPDLDTVLIGTQDQLLSRALNRGYGMSRFRWPVHFGLCNNDCLWVFDEVQLMGSGLLTSVQLQAFRNSLGTALPVQSIWMSATLAKGWLSTVDFNPHTQIIHEVTLSDADRDDPSLKRRFEAAKPISKVDITHGDLVRLANFIIQEHRPGTRTLVIVNTVKRAIALYEEIKGGAPPAEHVLLHSRFRPHDRLKSLTALLSPPSATGTICIATQVIEAGVDVSSTTLVTDLAPWPSLVQRFGRCNRAGVEDRSRVFWLDADFEKRSSSLPYTAEELANSVTILEQLGDASPKSLPQVATTMDQRHVLRRKDILDLFDTTPDLAGADIDISRFIRDTEDHDVQVFWRDLTEPPTAEEPAPNREELCNVSLGGLRAVKALDLWRWNHLEKHWERPSPTSLCPGQIILLSRKVGCYSSEKGWTGNGKDIPESLQLSKVPEESNDDDFDSATTWQVLAEHNDLVCGELDALLASCSLLDGAATESLRIAGRWHDAGKAHPVFQKAMLGDPPQNDPDHIWGKTALKSVRYERKGFRHELASALAMIEQGFPDLSVYLAAAHHGKVRLSIRSIPKESAPPDPHIRFARGVWEGDVLSEADLGDGQYLMPKTMNLSYMEFGEGPHGPSWLARMLGLRDDPELGPFRLGLLEAILRIADWRASRKAAQNDA